MDAERAACQIIEGMRGRRAEVILTPAGQVTSRVAGIAPELTSPAIGKQAFDRLTALGRAGASRFNERPQA